MAEGLLGGLILHTTDGGAHWNRQVVEEGESGSCMSVRFLSAAEVWAACGMTTSQIDIEAHYYHSTDGGGNWSKVVVPGLMPTSLSMSSPVSGFNRHHAP